MRRSDLESMVKAGTFREDLLYRLRVATIRLPAVRERAGDVPLLAGHFLGDIVGGGEAGARIVGFTPEAADAMGRYAWPGNVRELRSAVERAAIVAEGPRIGVADLPQEIRGVGEIGRAELGAMSYQSAMDAAREDATRRYLEAVLTRTRGRVTAAAEIAGIERESFYRLLRRYGVSPDDFRGRE